MQNKAHIWIHTNRAYTSKMYIVYKSDIYAQMIYIRLVRYVYILLDEWMIYGYFISVIGFM